MVGETADLVARLSLKDDFSARIRGIQKSVKGLDKSFSRTQASLNKTAANLKAVAYVGAGAVVAGIGASIKIAADFESQLNTINTIARVNQDELGKIGDTIRQVARDTGTPLEELTQGYYDLLSAGIKAADASSVLTAANKLAIGGLASTAETVDLLTTAINVYGADATKAASYADIFAKAVERGKVTAADLAGSFSQVGLIAKESGLEITEVAAAYARLTAGGTDAAEVSTQMRSALVALTKLTGPLEKLQKQTGKNYLAIAGSKGLVQALEEMRIDAEKAGVPLIDLLGRVEGLNFTLATTGGNFAAYNADLAAMGDAAGTAAGQMAERQKGLNFQLNRLKALAKDAGITIGTALLPKLTPLVEKLNDFVTKNQGNIEAFGTKLAQGFEDFAVAVGKVDWQPFIDGLTITGQIAKEAIGLFMSLPPDVQKLAIAALAVNKVTGGLGTSIVRDLAGLALRSLTHINAANVTVIGANVTGGGVPGGVVPMAGMNLASRLALGGVGILGVAGGSALLGAAAENAGQPVGYAAGIGGGAATIGGAGALGAAVGLGPLGIVAGSVLAVAQTAQNVSQQAASQAQGLSATLDASLAGRQTVSDLQTKLAAIDTGIAELNSNPIQAFLAGDALTTLQSMRDKTTAQLAALQAAQGRNSNKIGRDATTNREAEVARIWEGATKTSDAVNRNRTDTTTWLRNVHSAELATASAIRSIPPPIVNVYASVSASSVTHAQTTVQRHGNTTRVGGRP